MRPSVPVRSSTIGVSRLVKSVRERFPTAAPVARMQCSGIREIDTAKTGGGAPPFPAPGDGI